jgi:hypothetical protein
VYLCTVPQRALVSWTIVIPGTREEDFGRVVLQDQRSSYYNKFDGRVCLDADFNSFTALNWGLELLLSISATLV